MRDRLARSNERGGIGRIQLANKAIKERRDDFLEWA